MYHFLLQLVFASIWICLCTFSSCTPVSSEERPKLTVTEEPVRLKEFSSTPEALTIPEFSHWLKTQRGITYDHRENNKISISILYKPLVFEAALSAEDLSEAAVQKSIVRKEGYHYLRLECLDKNQSVSNPTNKESLFRQLKENLAFVRNEKDTVPNPIIEVFPGQLLNQPHQMLIMVPADTSMESLGVVLEGSPFGLKDLQLNITRKQLKSLPEIKF